jgi:hypothetical protein
VPLASVRARQGRSRAGSAAPPSFSRTGARRSRIGPPRYPSPRPRTTTSGGKLTCLGAPHVLDFRTFGTATGAQYETALRAEARRLPGAERRYVASDIRG